MKTLFNRGVQSCSSPCRPRGEIMSYRDPKPEDLSDPIFEAIWQTIKQWDINVPEEYSGYCGATGNHVCAILDAIRGKS